MMRAAMIIHVGMPFNGEPRSPYITVHCHVYDGEVNTISIDMIPEEFPECATATEHTILEGWCAQMARQAARMIENTLLKSVESGDLTPISACKLVTEVTPDPK